MTVSNYRDAANEALFALQSAIASQKTNIQSAMNQDQIAENETNTGPRIKVLQDIEAEHLTILALMSDTVSKFQAYETAVLNPSGLGDNAPTDGTNGN